MTEPFVFLHLVSKSYDEKTQVLKGITLSINRGEMAGVFGKSGSGKTTLLNLTGGIDVPDEGEIIVGGKRITGLDERSLTLYRRKDVGFIFQFFNLIPTLTVKENVLLPLGLLGGRDNEVLEGLLSRVELLEKMDAYPDRLSGGEMQRVALCRALIKDPQLVLADEPTGNLDSETGLSVVRLMKELSMDMHKTFIIATHDEEIRPYLDSCFILKDGRVVST
jgi:putative ABC transport system ATP-binding protein